MPLPGLGTFPVLQSLRGVHTISARKSWHAFNAAEQNGVVRQLDCAIPVQGVCYALLQGDGEEEEGTTESTGEGGVMMGGPARRRHRKGRHYDAKDDVILRLEALQPQEVKVRP